MERISAGTRIQRRAYNQESGVNRNRALGCMCDR